MIEVLMLEGCLGDSDHDTVWNVERPNVKELGLQQQVELRTNIEFSKNWFLSQSIHIYIYWS
jgi:hypothetical protein